MKRNRRQRAWNRFNSAAIFLRSCFGFRIHFSNIKANGVSPISTISFIVCLSLQPPISHPQPPRSSLLYQVAARLREFATIRAMEAAHNAIRTAAAATANGAAALALRIGESGKPCKLRMRSAQVGPPPLHAARSSDTSSACFSTPLSAYSHKSSLTITFATTSKPNLQGPCPSMPRLMSALQGSSCQCAIPPHPRLSPPAPAALSLTEPPADQGRPHPPVRD
jgi:hypothetical protein